jgi:hypothetical protein
MTSDHSHEAVQDAVGSAHSTPSSATATSNELDSIFNFSQLEGKDAGQQVCRCYSRNQTALCLIGELHSQLAILSHMMGNAVSIKEGAEAVLNGNAAQLTVILF